MNLRNASCSFFFFVIVVVASVGADPSFALGTPRGDAKALRASADRAVVREKFCEAAYLYKKLDEMEPTAETLVAASDAAAQGGDRAGAVRFLETFQSRHATHRLASTVAAKLEALRGAVSKYGAGAACSDPSPECGNGALEAGEDCEDGNRVDADQCPATCKLSGSAAAPPPPPPVVVPPVTPKTKTPPPPPPPVKVEPPPPVKVEPTKTTPPPDEEEPTPVPDDGADEPVRTPPPEEKAPPPPPPPPKEPAHHDSRGSHDRDGDGDEGEGDHDVRSIDDEAPDEAGGGGAPVGGIVLSILGGVTVLGGGAAAGYASIPFIRYVQNVPQQTTVQQNYLDARTASEKRDAAGAAADLRAALVKDANDWNGLYRWVATGGGVAAAAGVGMLVGGIILIASSGGDEDGAVEEDEDKADEEEDAEKDDEEERHGRRR